MTTRRSTYAARRRSNVGPACVPFLTTAFQDPDGPLPAPWYTPSVYSTFPIEIQGQRAIAPNALGLALLAGSDAADQHGEMTVELPSSGAQVRLLFRASITLSGLYGLHAQNVGGTVSVQWLVTNSGVTNLLGTAVTFPAPSGPFAIHGTIVGDQFTSEIFGVPGVSAGPSAADSALAFGEMGLMIQGAAGMVDFFSNCLYQ